MVFTRPPSPQLTKPPMKPAERLNNMGPQFGILPAHCLRKIMMSSVMVSNNVLDTFSRVSKHAAVIAIDSAQEMAQKALRKPDGFPADPASEVAIQAKVARDYLAGLELKRVHHLADVWLSSGKLRPASALFRQYIEDHRFSVMARHEWGEVLLRLGKQKKAMRQFRQAEALTDMKQQPFDLLGPRALRRKAWLADWDKDRDEIDQWFRRAIWLKPDYAEAHGGYALFLARDELFEEAEYHFSRADILGPDNFNIIKCYAYVQFKQQKFAAALVNFDRAVGIKSRRSDVHHYRGRALMKLGRYSDAEEAYRQTIRLGADLPDVRARLAGAQSGQGKYSAAVEHLVVAVQARPDDRSLRLSLGETWMHLGDYRRAEACALLVRQADPLMGRASLLQAKAQFELGLYSSAYSAFQDAYSIENDIDAQLLLSWGKNCVAMGAHERARSLFCAAEAGGANAGDQAKSWGDGYYRCGNYHDAATQYQIALTTYPTRARIMVRLAHSLYVINRVNEAEAHLQQAIALVAPMPRQYADFIRVLFERPSSSMTVGALIATVDAVSGTAQLAKAIRSEQVVVRSSFC